MSVTFGNFAEFVVGNTYERIPAADAKLDHTGRRRRVHDWTVYVEIVDGDVDVIDHVVFDCGPTFFPRKYEHGYPVRSSKTNRWRFQSRQQTYGLITVVITLVGVGGKELKLDYLIRPKHPQHEEQHSRHFVEPGFPNKIEPRTIPDVGFALRMLLSASNDSMNQVHIQAMKDHVESTNGWNFIHDDAERNYRIESSSALQGNDELEKCKSFLQHLQHLLEDNAWMNFQVMVMVPNPSIDKVCKLCQNFIKYEDAIDLILRVPSEAKIKSNKRAMQGSTNQARHEQVAACSTIRQLCEAMNPDRTPDYKLNLLNLHNSSHSCIEFWVPHCASSEQVIDFVRFCLTFVHNSFRFKPPSSLKDGRSVEDQLDMLFRYVIKDRGLERNIRSLFADPSKCSIETPSDFSAITAPDQTSTSCDMSFDPSTLSSSLGGISFGDIDRTLLEEVDSVPYPDTMNTAESVNSLPSGGVRKRPRYEIAGATMMPAYHNPGLTTHAPPYVPTNNSKSQKHSPLVFKRHEIHVSTTRLMGNILKSINGPRKNQKKLRMEELQNYFKLKTKDCQGCLEIRVIGAPHFFLIKPRGIKVSVEKGKQIQSPLSDDELKRIFQQLELALPDDSNERVAELDKFLDKVYSSIEVKGVRVKEGRSETLVVKRGGVGFITRTNNEQNTERELTPDELEGVLDELCNAVPDLAVSPIPTDKDARIVELDRIIEEIHKYVLVAWICQ